jgi:hypothetical protein
MIQVSCELAIATRVVFRNGGRVGRAITVGTRFRWHNDLLFSEVMSVPLVIPGSRRNVPFVLA